MSKYEAITIKKVCGNCIHIDDSVVFTSNPPQARCALYDEFVFLNSETCIEDILENNKSK